jgi:hypothetical protein
MNLLFMQFSATSRRFIPLRSKYSPQHPVLKQLQSVIRRHLIYIQPFSTRLKKYVTSNIAQNT